MRECQASGLSCRSVPFKVCSLLQFPGANPSLSPLSPSPFLLLPLLPFTLPLFSLFPSLLLLYLQPLFLPFPCLSSLHFSLIQTSPPSFLPLPVSSPFSLYPTLPSLFPSPSSHPSLHSLFFFLFPSLLLSLSLHPTPPSGFHSFLYPSSLPHPLTQPFLLFPLFIYPSLFLLASFHLSFSPV